MIYPLHCFRSFRFIYYPIQSFPVIPRDHGEDIDAESGRVLAVLLEDLECGTEPGDVLVGREPPPDLPTHMR